MANECLTCCNNNACDLISEFGLTRFIHCAYRNSLIIRANKRLGNYEPTSTCKKHKGWTTVQVPDIELFSDGWNQDNPIVTIQETKCSEEGKRRKRRIKALKASPTKKR